MSRPGPAWAAPTPLGALLSKLLPPPQGSWTSGPALLTCSPPVCPQEVSSEGRPRRAGSRGLGRSVWFSLGVCPRRPARPPSSQQGLPVLRGGQCHRVEVAASARCCPLPTGLAPSPGRHERHRRALPLLRAPRPPHSLLHGGAARAASAGGRERGRRRPGRPGRGGGGRHSDEQPRPRAQPGGRGQRGVQQPGAQEVRHVRGECPPASGACSRQGLVGPGSTALGPRARCSPLRPLLSRELSCLRPALAARLPAPHTRALAHCASRASGPGPCCQGSVLLPGLPSRAGLSVQLRGCGLEVTCSRQAAAPRQGPGSESRLGGGGPVSAV